MMRNLLLFVFFMVSTCPLPAQVETEAPGIGFVLMDNATNKPRSNGVFYIGDDVTAKLVFPEKGWADKSLYCYVVIHSENTSVFQLAYPDDGWNIGNRFPQTDKDGKPIREIQLFEGQITEPLGKDNIFVILTEGPVSNFKDIFNLDASDPRSVGFKKEELLKFLKGSRLSALYRPEFGQVIVKTLQIETRPAREKNGVFEKGVNVNSVITPPRSLKKVFSTKDSAEIFYTPQPQKDIIRDDFPTIDLIDPVFDTTVRRGLKVLPAVESRKVLIRGIAVDRRSGVSKILVNHNPPTTYREASGFFDYLYELKDGMNTVDVAVENKEGYRRVIRLQFHYTAKEDKVEKEGRDYLMVIGINKYRSFQVLNNAAKDALDFKQLMIDQYGYRPENVIELFDEAATKKNIYNQLIRFVDSLGENDRLLVYYSGHGLYKENLELGYWLPVNAVENEYDEYLDNLGIARLIQKMRAKNIFVIADACYSGSLVRDMQRENNKEFKSRIILCSGKLRPVPDGVAGSNSPFAAKVLQFLKNASEDRVLASELIQYIKQSFQSNADQKPVGGAVDEVGDENGDFIFKKGK